MKKSFIDQYLSWYNNKRAKEVNSRFTRKTIREVIVKHWEDGQLDIVEPHSQDVNISSSIFANHDAGMMKKDLNVILKKNLQCTQMSFDGWLDKGEK